MLIRRCFAAVTLLLFCETVTAEEIRAAVASNFAHAAEAIARRFEEISEHRVVLVFGSTGKHYAQILNGAPFDAFFAADERHPRLLESEGLTVPGSRFTYAKGRLVLWSLRAGYVDAEGRVLERGDFRHLAIANPRLAPYGGAAQEVLQARGLWERLQHRLVRGENLGQTHQFVRSGNAELGFVALSQLVSPEQDLEEGSHWAVPEALHTPILQQAVLLRDTEAARAFSAYVRTDEARSVLRSYGYETP